MSKTRVWITVCCCALPVAALAWAQAGRKPGLYEITSQMNMAGAGAPQMPQMPPGMQIATGHADAAVALRAAHHAGLRDPGHDRQVRRSSPARSVASARSLYLDEDQWHDGKDHLYRADECDRHGKIHLDRRRRQPDQDAYDRHHADGAELAARRHDDRNQRLSTRAPTAAA